jgi:hypothetical protein
MAAIVLASLARAQAPVTLQEQLNAQYKTVHIGIDGSIAGDTGTLLAVQKGGIIAVPWRSLAKCPAKFHDNDLYPSTGFCANMVKNTAGVFKKGAKVYPTKIEVDYNKAKITFHVVRCDSCYNDSVQRAMQGEVVFEFAKGYLERANAGEVEDTIGQVFAITDDQQAQGGDDQGQQQQAQQQQGGQQQPAQPQMQAEPQTVQLGMTTDQVQSVLGKPDKIFDVGAKQIYIYKDVKVTFLNGKVSDVQ